MMSQKNDATEQNGDVTEWILAQNGDVTEWILAQNGDVTEEWRNKMATSQN